MDCCNRSNCNRSNYIELNCISLVYFCALQRQLNIKGYQCSTNLEFVLFKHNVKNVSDFTVFICMFILFFSIQKHSMILVSRSFLRYMVAFRKSQSVAFCNFICQFIYLFNHGFFCLLLCILYSLSYHYVIRVTRIVYAYNEQRGFTHKLTICTKSSPEIHITLFIFHSAHLNFLHNLFEIVCDFLTLIRCHTRSLSLLLYKCENSKFKVRF